MRSRTPRTAPLLFAITLWTTCSTARAQLAYEAIDLGSLGTWSHGLGLNDAGWVVGQSYDGFHGRPFLVRGAGMEDLGTLGGVSGSAYAVSNSGLVAGQSGNGHGKGHAFLWNGVQHDLGALGADPDNMASAGLGVNNAGHVVGYSWLTGPGDMQAFFYDGLAMAGLDPLGRTQSIAYGINNSDVAVGVLDPFGSSMAFVNSGGVSQELGTLPNGTMSIAYAVNDAGLTVGSSDDGTDAADAGDIPSRAAVFLGGGVVESLGLIDGAPDDPTLMSEAYGVNNRGQIVGYSDLVNGDRHAFLWSGGTMYDVNSLLTNPLGWDIEYAYGINDNGWIVGYGTTPDGQEHAVLLTPEPGMAAMFVGVGLGGLLALRRRRR